jgi:hypothetical protein
MSAYSKHVSLVEHSISNKLNNTFHILCGQPCQKSAAYVYHPKSVSHQHHFLSTHYSWQTIMFTNKTLSLYKNDAVGLTTKQKPPPTFRDENALTTVPYKGIL